ncbi:hypothetical protein GCM10010172_24130 [Paractinoplanes ferrugineus]|uniref:G5 domain-containing protein n=1 Tax=Paractinoplanes ferrugineus TaxID=113564 RepID=A0A919J158_9ACTN|nr:G5 domain-containing protein [Actinoplanes ferrugineus]GIE08676.1 hypothetical protein Afe05nite_05160 [Actinoplanes ferrugineus]
MTTLASALLLVVGGGVIGIATLVLGDDKTEADTDAGRAAAGPALVPPADESPVEPPVFRGDPLPPVVRDVSPADRTLPRSSADFRRPGTAAAQGRAQAQTRAQSQARTRAQGRTQPRTRTRTQSRTRTQPRTWTQPRARPQTQLRTRVQARPQLQTRPQVRTRTRIQTRPQTRTQTQTRPQVRPHAPAGTSTTAARPAAPVTITRTEVETRAIPFETQVFRDPTLPRGTRRVERPGVPGMETVRYSVTVTRGRPGARRLIDSTVTKQPQDEIVALGSRSRRHTECGPCVPLGLPAACTDESAATADPDVVLLDQLELSC